MVGWWMETLWFWSYDKVTVWKYNRFCHYDMFALLLYLTNVLSNLTLNTNVKDKILKKKKSILITSHKKTKTQDFKNISSGVLHTRLHGLTINHHKKVFLKYVCVCVYVYMFVCLFNFNHSVQPSKKYDRTFFMLVIL